MKRFAAGLFFLSIGLVAACGGSSESNMGAMSNANDADVMFAQMMIPHHQQAVEMSDIALTSATNANQQVKDLASQIKAAQDPEITQMTALLNSWGKSPKSDDHMHHSESMSGMLSDFEMVRLGTLSGAEFDVTWVDAMIAHHEGAIEMAEEVLKNGKNSEILTLASAIISAQATEIETLRTLRNSLG